MRQPSGRGEQRLNNNHCRPFLMDEPRLGGGTCPPAGRPAGCEQQSMGFFKQLAPASVRRAIACAICSLGRERARARDKVRHPVSPTAGQGHWLRGSNVICIPRLEGACRGRQEAARRHPLKRAPVLLHEAPAGPVVASAGGSLI